MSDHAPGPGFPVHAPFGEDSGVVVVDKGQLYEGNVTFQGTGRIEGDVRGQVFSAGTLIIAEGARVEGTVAVGALIVYGTLQGAAQAERSIELRAPARVRADLKTPVLVTERGVLFDGRCQMAPEEPVIADTPLEETAVPPGEDVPPLVPEDS